MHGLFAHNPIALVSASRHAIVYVTVVFGLSIHSVFVISTIGPCQSNVEIP